MSSFKSSSRFLNLRAIFSRFEADKRGNVAVIFAITLLPILGLIGAAVDYSRANNARTALQTALDTTALMISRDAVTIPPSEIQARAQQYFNALYTHNADAPATNFVATYTPASAGKSATIAITANNSITTDFMKVLGPQFQTINLSGASTTTWGSTRLRVALALDNTGSMQSSGKMPALKTAAKNLIDSLSAQSAVAGDLMISIVPFAKDVNVGSSNYNKSWIKWSGESDTWDENNGTCSKSGNYKTKSSCEAQNVCSISGNNSKNSCQSAGVCSNPNYKTQSSCAAATGCSKSQYTTQNSCTSNRGTWTVTSWTSGVWSSAVWTPNNHSTWTGCVTDRTQDYDTTSTLPSPSNADTLFPAEQYSDCPAEITPLSTNWSQLKQNIDAMNPNGNTNQAIGMAWGWLTLLQQDPMNAPAEDTDYKYTDVVILLSDGDNTQNRFSSNQSQIDARQKKLCDNAKASGIQIYTIQVNTNNDNTSSVMSYCASGSANYFSTTTASGIGTAFTAISGSLSKLRITK